MLLISENPHVTRTTTATGRFNLVCSVWWTYKPAMRKRVSAEIDACCQTQKQMEVVCTEAQKNKT